MPERLPSPEPPSDRGHTLTERALQRCREWQAKHLHPNESIYPKDSSPDARKLQDHIDAIGSAWHLMPEGQMKDLLLDLVQAGSIERRDTPTPRWALSANDVKAICAILGMSENELGIRSFGGDVLSENYPHSPHSHYVNAPFPVMLLLRAKIDEEYRKTVGKKNANETRESRKQRTKQRQRQEQWDRMREEITDEEMEALMAQYKYEEK